jgi:phosphoribosylformylglycinamidine cyclo-ligase
MFRAFNMGVGLILVCAADYEQSVLRAVSEAGERGFALGRVVAGERDVRYRP